MNTVQLLWETYCSPDTKIDVEAGVIRDVKVLGRLSKNGREYSPQAIQEIAKFYEGIDVNIDHVDRNHPEADRKLSDAFGYLEGVQIREDGIYASLHYLKSHPMAPVVIEAAQRMPSKLGLSHQAYGKSVKKGKLNVVESIESVRCVDLVRNSATTRGLFESENAMENLTEQEGMAGEVPGGEPASEFASMIMKVLAGSDDKASKLKKIKAILDAEEKLSAAMNDKPKETSEGAAVEESERHDAGELTLLREQVEQLTLRDKARDLLESAGITASPVRIKALVALREEMDMKSLIETWDHTPASRGASGVRSASRLTESENYKYPASLDSLVSSLRGSRN